MANSETHSDPAKPSGQHAPQIYVAGYSDAQSIIDLALNPTREHFNFVQAAITARQCYVARIEQIPIGYAVMANTFFGHAFISHLFIHPDHRRRRIGSALIRYLENQTTGDKIFTAIGQSNQPAHKLFEKHNYQASGQIDNLSHHGTERIYFKSLK